MALLIKEKKNSFWLVIVRVNRLGEKRREEEEEEKRRKESQDMDTS